MEGRDIGTNVFPNANIKIYLDASADERAKRRYKQNLENNIECDYNELLQSIIDRYNKDKTSSIAPLKQAEDAIYVDTTCLTIEEMTNKVIDIIRNVKNKKTRYLKIVLNPKNWTFFD